MKGLRKILIKFVHTLDCIGEREPKKNLPVIYLVTATYKRPEQLPDLTRMAQTLMHVPSIMWLVIEDAQVLNPHVADLLRRSGIPHVHKLGNHNTNTFHPTHLMFMNGVINISCIFPIPPSTSS